MTQTPTPRREPPDPDALANDIYVYVCRPETIWWDDLTPEMQDDWRRAARMVEGRQSEAVRQALSELEEEVGGLAVYLPPKPFGPDDEYLDRTAVIELIHKKGAGE